MKKLKVMLLLHSAHIPPEDLKDPEDPRMEKYETEVDVINAIRSLGHDLRIVAVDDDIAPIRKTVEEWKPHIAYNLLEAFAENGALDYYVVSYLDMLKVPYTGCNPRGLLLSRDKALSKKLLSYHRIRIPKFKEFPYGQKIKPASVAKLPYPMIIKSMIEQGSVGIAQASYVENAEDLITRVQQVHEMTQHDVIAEQYIDGRELYVGVLGNKRLEVLPIRELVFDKIDDNMHRIATYNVKWNREYREKWGIDYQFSRNLPAGAQEKIQKLVKRIFKILSLSSYARMDLRLSNDGKLYVLEANANPAIGASDDLAFSAEKAGYSYEKLIQKILTLGLSVK
jgi:D-alanine-D-alanine ligase